MSEDQKSADYTNSSQQALMAVVEYLSRHVLTPQPIAAIQADTGLSRDQVFRSLWNAEQGGWAEQTDSGWHISPHLTQLSERLRLTIAQLHNHYLENK